MISFKNQFNTSKHRNYLLVYINIHSVDTSIVWYSFLVYDMVVSRGIYYRMYDDLLSQYPSIDPAHAVEYLASLDRGVSIVVPDSTNGKWIIGIRSNKIYQKHYSASGWYVTETVYHPVATDQLLDRIYGLRRGLYRNISYRHPTPWGGRVEKKEFRTFPAPTQSTVAQYLGCTQSAVSSWCEAKCDSHNPILLHADTNMYQYSFTEIPTKDWLVNGLRSPRGTVSYFVPDGANPSTCPSSHGRATNSWIDESDTEK